MVNMVTTHGDNGNHVCRNAAQDQILKLNQHTNTHHYCTVSINISLHIYNVVWFLCRHDSAQQAVTYLCAFQYINILIFIKYVYMRAAAIYTVYNQAFHT